MIPPASIGERKTANTDAAHSVLATFCVLNVPASASVLPSSSLIIPAPGSGPIVAYAHRVFATFCALNVPASASARPSSPLITPAPGSRPIVAVPSDGQVFKEGGEKTWSSFWDLPAFDQGLCEPAPLQAGSIFPSVCTPACLTTAVLPSQTSQPSGPRQPRPCRSSSLCDYTCGSRAEVRAFATVPKFEPL